GYRPPSLRTTGWAWPARRRTTTRGETPDTALPDDPERPRSEEPRDVSGFLVRNAWLVPFLPLAGAAIAAAGGRWLKGRSHWPVVLGIGLSFLVSLGILFSFAPAQGHEGAAGEGEAAAVAGAGEGGSG